ncbi:FAD-binding protein [Cryobacterium levicorallinum]|uniref:FAD-binding protein n=1 Tax=Cryobacterium levicorallinum TaxID=995038 RepID=A0A1I3B599_9MICO|nr:FAD-linked oxidase C-terminal domain-containing protein [Cryobacterium levicorallinum]TFB83450.1 FAD-binding protein [Cryobacterium levicorallinum]GEP26973.1 glycolate oxidase [Cryobacterium levicorallinum]SFH57467.1 glycolate oxidase [Cryobacterium levicorallinum]
MNALTRLQTELGDIVSIDPLDLAASRTDKSGWVADGTPLAIVRATEVDQVQAVLRIATEFRVPVVTRGAGTGLSGGACGTDGSIVLSVAGLNRILEINADDELAIVEAGVINQHLNDVLAEKQLWFTPDPASKAISTVGGNIATNAGGLLCAKYGVTREAVLGLVVVLADGSLLRTGHRTIKGVTGYDLTALLTGSEGTLGVIVEATVRVRALTAGTVATIGAVFETVTAAAAASAAVTAARIRPAVMELIDPIALAHVATYLGPEGSAGLPLGRGAFLLVQTDGPAALAEAEHALIVLRAAGGEATLSTDAASGERLLAMRRAMHPALKQLGQVLIEDVSVPRSRMAEMFAAIADISTRTGIPIPTVAHAGDGNLHPNFVIERQPGAAADAPVPDEIWAAADEMFRAALALGGTLTGEHGVGVLKRRWLRDEIGDRSLNLQRQLKAVFDPLGILNAGTMFAA